MRLCLARFKVKDRSMEPTLNEGSHVLVNRLAYRRRVPQVGDVIVLRHPREDVFLVKRVERLEGDRVYVVGDSGEHSVDSRSFGPVRRELIVGKVLFHRGQRTSG